VREGRGGGEMPDERRQTGTLSKAIADRIGRLFNLLYNRVTMYHLDHPSTRETIKHFHQALADGLKAVSPLAVVLDKEKIYVEEEPLDPRVNAQRLVGYMKKAGVQSVSFERGLSERELMGLAKVLGDAKSYPTSEEMKRGLVQQGVQGVRINHVFFKKMTVDQEVVGRGMAPSAAGPALTEVLIDTSREWGEQEAHPPASAKGPSLDSAFLQELYQSLTLTLLMEDPAAISQKFLEAEEVSKEGTGEPRMDGAAVLQGIRQLRSRVEQSAFVTRDPASMESLVEAVFKLREELNQGIEKRKQQGVLLRGEDLIHQEMDDLTDQVMVQLIREEYRGGDISVKRLAQIIRRMMPDIRELKRLLPKLKEALLADGMPLSDYLQLVRELERELQSEDLAVVLEEGAEQIGLSAQDLIREIRKDPKAAAELIALAAEVRAFGAGDQRNVLSQVLVDYVERVGGALALEQVDREGPEGVQRLRDIVSQIQDELLGRLKGHLMESSLVKEVRENVEKRRARTVQEFQTEWLLRRFLQETETRRDPQAILQAVEVAYPDPSQQGEVLELVIQAMEAKGLDPSPMKAALAQRVRVAPGESDPHRAPKGTYNRSMILFFIREEVKRAQRYPYSFSAMLLSVRLATAMKPVPIGMIRPHEVRNAVMERVVELLRDVDLIGCLEENKVLIILPHTGSNGAKVVAKRIMEAIDGKALTVRNVPMKLRLALAEDTFQKDRTPDLKALLARMEAKLAQSLKA